MLDNPPEVRSILERRVRHETRKQLEQPTGDRARLLVPQGQLRFTPEGLVPVTRNVFSALRSAMPYCVELEERLGRMYIRTLTQTIVPSAGVYVRSMLACQHDTLGVTAATWPTAKTFGYRVPAMGMENIIPLPKNLRKALVHPDIMDSADGDSDGDTFNVQDDPEIVDMMREHHIEFEVEHKVEKVKAKGEISRTALIALSIRGYRDANLVGQLTMLMHQFLWITPDHKRAQMAGLLAKMAPMTLKNDVTTMKDTVNAGVEGVKKLLDEVTPDDAKAGSSAAKSHKSSAFSLRTGIDLSIAAALAFLFVAPRRRNGRGRR